MTARLRLHRAVGSAFTRTYGVWGAGIRWLALRMTRVGYGDKIPVILAGRIIALVWMFDNIRNAATACLDLRRFLSNDIPACLSFSPSSVLRQPLYPLHVGFRESEVRLSRPRARRGDE